MPEYKQVNYKLPPSLVEALSAKAKEENRTATSLVIEALGQILEISPSLQPQRIENELYEFVQELQKRIEHLEKSDVDKILYDRIYSVENRLEVLESNIEKDIDKNIEYKSIDSDIDEGIEIQNIEKDIDKFIEIPPNNPEKGQLQLLESEPINEKASDSRANLSIQSEEFEGEIGHKKIAELANMGTGAVRARHARGQSISCDGIEYIPSGRKGKPKWKIQPRSPVSLSSNSTEESTKVEIEVVEPITEATTQEIGLEEVSSSKLLKLLRRIDPDKRWNGSKLQTIRVSAKQKERWQEINGYQFKWADKQSASPQTEHLWLLKSPNT